MSPDLGHNGHLEDLVAGYIDRLLAGETLDFDEILAEHPDTGEEIFKHLESYVDIGSGRVEDAPLGTLGDYTLRRQIGRGGMGVVYEAWENSMDRAVALKVLPAGIAADDRAVTRFTQEARLAGKLNHENVVRVYSIGVKEGTPWYAMELVEGETLSQILARIKDAEPETETPFGPKDQVGYFADLAEAFADVADGLQHAHSKGVTHRDIKPSNLILDAEGRLRILDFGLARLEGQESLTVSGDFVGTPLYMSPEQARRKKIPLDHRTDVYSLGATMYEVLCGRPPFRGKDHADTLSRIIERDPVEPRKENPRVPRGLETIVLKCLRKDAGDRYGTAEALAQDLRRFVRGDPIEARPEGRWEVFARKVRRQKGRLAVAGLFSILVFAVVWLAWWNQWQAERRREMEYPTQVLEAADVIRLAELAFRGSSGQTSGFEFAESYVPFLSVADIAALGQERLPARITDAVKDLAQASENVPARPEAPYYRARGLRMLGREAAALEALDDALQRDCQFVPALALRAELEGTQEELTVTEQPAADWVNSWLRAHLAMREKRWGDAIEALDKLIASLSSKGEPYVGAEVEFYLHRGQAQKEVRQFHSAILDFARAGRRGLLEPALRLGQTLYLRDHEGDREAAEREFRNLYDSSTSKKEKSERAVWIASAYRSLRDEEKGLVWTEKVESEPLRARLKTVFLIHQGNFEKGIEASAKAVDLDDGNALSHTLHSLAIFYHLHHRGIPETDRWEKALVASAEKAYKLDRTCFTSRMLHGEILRRQGQIDEARQLSEEIISQAPRKPFGYILRARVLSDEERYKEAEGDSRKAVSLAPEFAWAHLMLGYALMYQRNPHEALKSCEKALDLEPRFLWAWTWKGRAHGLLGEYEEAILAFERSFEIQPYNPDRRFDYGRVLEAMGDVSAALAVYATSLCQNPAFLDVYGKLIPLLRDATPTGSLPAREFHELLEVLESRADLPREEDTLRLETVALLRHALRDHKLAGDGETNAPR